MAQPFAFAATAPLIPAAATGTVGYAQLRDPSQQTALTASAKLQLLRQKIKYVFVLFQENRSFDHYFGTYPGANGLFPTPGVLPVKGAASTPLGYFQTIIDIDGSTSTISPFLIPQTVKATTGVTVQLYPEDTTSIDHSHTGIDASAHFASDRKTVANDAYALDEEGLEYNASGVIVSKSTGVAPTGKPTLAQKQMGELALAHVDCDTIPFLWQYADRFTLFDNFHQTTIGPSTPNAIAMIAGQSGETQWVLHPALGAAGQVPVVGDPPPFPGSTKDTSPVKPSWGADESVNNTNGLPVYSTNVATATHYAPNDTLTFATLPLSFMGTKINQVIAQDENPAADLLDIQHDIFEVASKDPAVQWGWYQQGYGPEPFDGTTTNEDGKHDVVHPAQGSYIVHHNGPQYFGYLGDNKTELKSLHGLGQFYKDIAAGNLPTQGGVFYVRGGYYNNDGLQTRDPTVVVRETFPGNDDHPGYSDAQISEALLADSINAIANSPYWSESAIIITYDETDGLYDHAAWNVRSWDQNGAPLAGGPRISTIVISPYGAAHTISQVYSEHSSVIKFIDEMFGLLPLADLPDEQRARALGQREFNQANLGPADDVVTPMGDLTESFDNDRLLGNAAALPASYATIASSTVLSLPHYAGAGCKTLGITPTEYTSSGTLLDPPPVDFNPRPGTNPGTPTSGDWTP
jgi:phospholipase C